MPATVTPIDRETRRRERRLALSLPISLTAFVVFYLLAQRDWRAPPMPWDERLTRWVQSVRLPGARRLMHWISWPGFPPQNWALTTLAAAALHRGGFRVAPWIVLAALPVEAAVAWLKYQVKRDRPVRPNPAPRFWPADPSFPSGHTVQYTLVFGFLAHLTRLNVRHAPARWIGISGLGLLIALIGPSRVYLGHHWPTDVLAGYSLGLGLLFSFVQLYELIRLKARNRPEMHTATDAVSTPLPARRGLHWLHFTTRT
jgi:undecaprenyl-diphosphatase